MTKKVTVNLKGMTPEQKREYNRNQKQRQRDREKQERIAAQVPEARSYLLPAYQRDELLSHADQLTKKIAAELGTEPDGFIVDMLACVILGHERDWTKRVHSPSGVLYGGYFPDNAASTIIEYVHRNPTVKDSQEFTALYGKFLSICKQLSRQISWFEHTYAEEVKAEMDGTKLPEPNPAKQEEPPSVPKDTIAPPEAETEQPQASQLPYETEVGDSTDYSQDLDPRALRYLSGDALPPKWGNIPPWTQGGR